MLAVQHNVRVDRRVLREMRSHRTLPAMQVQVDQEPRLMFLEHIFRQIVRTSHQVALLS